MQSVPCVCFTARSLHITENDPFSPFVPHSQHQADFLYNPARVHFTEDSRLLLMVLDRGLLHTNGINLKTRNLWFENLFTMCTITNLCVIY